jgi:hypothetical protein
MSYIIGLIFLLIGIVAGLNLPDLDSRVSFLVHRSIVTHSFFFPILLFWIAHKKVQPTIRFLSMGFSLSIAAHLCFDLFPRAWTGFALISIPLYGRASSLFSWLWIAGSIVLCLYLALLLIKNLGDVIIVVSSIVVSFGFCATAESVFWPALSALIGATLITLMLPSSSSAVLRKPMRKFVSGQGDNQWKVEITEQS